MAVIDVAMVSWPNCPQRVAYMADVRSGKGRRYE